MEIKKTKLLFVDDESSILSSFKRLFIEEPYELFFANSAIEGLKVVNSYKPDIIICDLMMPDINGIDFFKKVKSESPQTIRIMISADSQKENIVKAVNSGEVWKYILKPWNDDELIQVVKEALGKIEKGVHSSDQHHSANKEKKIFFLNPPDVFRQDILIDFIHSGYECYYIDDPQRTKIILQKYNNSLLFINIDSPIKESSWEKYIIEIMKFEETANVLIGVISYNTDSELRKKYLFNVGIHCGFIQLKAGLFQIKNILYRVFEANEAKGRREAVRVIINHKEEAMFNIKYNNQLFSGEILDISTMAMACTLQEQPKLEIDDYLDNIQLKLKGVPIQTSGSIRIKRIQNGEILFIVMFDLSISLEKEKKICAFIYKILHEKIEEDTDKYILEQKINKSE